MFDKGISTKEREKVRKGIEQLLILGKAKDRIEIIGDNSPKAEKDIVSYLKKGKIADGKFDGDEIIDAFMEQQLAEEKDSKCQPSYKLLITDAELPLLKIGVSRRNCGAVVTNKLFQTLEKDWQEECLVTITMQRLGYVFGIPSLDSPATEKGRIPHCKNTCIMRKAYEIKDWTKLSTDRINNEPLCEECQKHLQEFLKTTDSKPKSTQ